MDCIIKVNEYSYGNLKSSELYGESQDRTKLQPIANGGLTLTVAAGHYRVTNAANNVLRQGLSDGTPASIFEIYDSMTIPCEPLRVVTEGFDGQYDNFEETYGYGRIVPDVKTKWYAFTESTVGETAIGITREAGGYVKEIHSLYVEEPMSRKERTEYLCEYIYDKLSPTEYASISYTGFSFDRINVFSYGNGAIKAYGMSKESNKAEQPHLLADDALERKSSVTEVFDPGFKYTVQHLFSEEKETDNDGTEKA